MGSKSEKVLGLFLGIALVLTSGCASNNGHTHVDNNKDGYCDIDGEPMPRSSHYSTSNYRSARESTTSDNISSGSAPKGGIGSHSSGGGG
jgi:hypothetical protein